MAHAVLVCDDDAEIRATMRRTLRGYEVTEVSSPREALDTLKTKVFDAIVSDYAMGTDSDGLDLLQQVRLMYPAMARFLVTGNRDMDVAVRAVNEGAVTKFFLKPWNDEQLRAALDLVLRSRLGA
jgi:DNA-binding NtrC family response regulator